jgi:hypothetical protein
MNQIVLSNLSILAYCSLSILNKYVNFEEIYWLWNNALNKINQMLVFDLFASGADLPWILFIHECLLLFPVIKLDLILSYIILNCRLVIKISLLFISSYYRVFICRYSVVIGHCIMPFPFKITLFLSFIHLLLCPSCHRFYAMYIS